MKSKFLTVVGITILSGGILISNIHPVSAIVNNSNSQSIIKGNGQILTSVKSISEFSKVNVSGNITVVVTDQLSSSAEVTTDSNIQEHINIDNVNGTLNIYTKGMIKSSKDILVRIPYGNNLASITASASSKISVLPSIYATNFDLKVSSSAICNIDSIHATGTLTIGTQSSGSVNIVKPSIASNTTISVSSSGKLNGENLSSDNVKVKASSSGLAVFRVKEKLDAIASSSGKVRYFGIPISVTTKRMSSGQVVNLNN